MPRDLAITSRVPGNPWFVCTMWLARYRLQRALPSGTMAEQLHPYTGEPLSVSPPTCSHGEYVGAVQEYIERRSRADLCPSCGQARHPTERRPDRQMVASEA